MMANFKFKQPPRHQNMVHTYKLKKMDTFPNPVMHREYEYARSSKKGKQIALLRYFQ